MSDVDLDALVVGRGYLVTFRGQLTDADHGAARQFRTSDGWHPIVGTACLVSVEPLPLPLPTTPGERFWASLDKTKPCWWFVTTQRGTEGVWYVSQYGIGHGHPCGVNSTSIAAARLVRLPDPTEASS